MKPFYLHDVRVEPRRHRLVHADRTLGLEKRIMDVLVVLAEEPGRVVGREEILERVWSDRTVTEESLTQTISRLRQALGDSPRTPRFVETIPKRGYRLVAPVLDAPPGRRPVAIFATLATLALAAALAIAVRWHESGPEPAEAAVLRPITSDPGVEFDPAFDPAGRRIAYVAPAADRDDLEIFVRDLEVASPRALTASPGFDGSPAWSPDGRFIAYMHSNAEDPECEVRVQAVDGADVRAVAPCHAHSESSVAWSPRGEIVFADRRDGESFRLFQVDLEHGAEPEPLTEPPAGSYGDLDPAFSPDGHSLAFVRGELPSVLPSYVSPVLGDVWVMDLDTKETRRLTRDLAEVPGVSWSRDGRTLLFASDRETGQHALWSVDRSGRFTPRRLLAVDGMIRNPVEGPSGLVFERVRGQVNLYRVDLAGDRALRRIDRSERSEGFPAVDPGGSRLAYVSDRSGWPEIWVSSLDGSGAVQLTCLRSPSTQRPAFSPDGRELVFASRRDGATRLYRVPASGGEVREVTSGADPGVQDLVPAWSRDDRILFGSNRSGSWQIWTTSTDGGEPSKVTRDGGFAPVPTADGELYFTRLDAPGIWRRNAGGSETRVVDRHWEKNWANWTIRDSWLYQLGRTGWTTGRIRRLNLETGEEEVLIDLEADNNLSVVGLAVSPDSRWLLLAIRDRLDFDLMAAE